MAELIVLRHAQAALGADDYDQLSATGMIQARYFGEYLAGRKLGVDRIVIGGQKRHAQTLDAIREGTRDHLLLSADVQIDPRLNEYDHENLLAASGVDVTELKRTLTDPRDYFRLLRSALKRWITGELSHGVAESWDQFEARVGSGFASAWQGHNDIQRTLLVSSGGPISCMIKQVLELAPHKTLELNLQLRNTGMSQFFFGNTAIRLNSFNHTPHLDIPDRTELVTYS